METTLILKPNKKKTLPYDLGLVVLFCAAAFYAFWKLQSSVGNLQFIMAGAALLIFSYLIISLCLQQLPGQGDLLLTPNGFEVKTIIKRNRRKHNWSDISHFYVGKVSVDGRVNFPNKETPSRERVCFDLISSGKQQSSLLSMYRYHYTEQELTDLMNSWKNKHSNITQLGS